MEQLRMNDGFENSSEKEPKRSFIVIDFENEDDPKVVFGGEATSEDEAKEIIEREKGIVIDFEKNPNIEIAFQTGDDNEWQKAA